METTILSRTGRMPCKQYIFVLLAAVYAGAGIVVLKDYLEWRSVNLIIGLAALPFTSLPLCRTRASYRMLWPAAVLLVLHLALPLKTLFFLSLCSLLLLLYESTGRRATLLSLLTLLLISPVCQYFAHVFSFPVRLWLTEVAGSLLQRMGQQVGISGNMISCNGAEFSVDPACMGLNMLVTSLLCGLILVALHQYRNGRKLQGYWVMAILSSIFLLNVIANLVRILLLVYFRLLPGDAMHGVSGLLCLLLYVLLPASFLVALMVKRLGRPLRVDAGIARPPSAMGYRLHILMVPLFALAAYQSNRQQSLPVTQNLPELRGYTVSWYDQEVLKIAGDHALIYVKPARGFVYTDHNPLLCWTGSGYTFERIQEQQWDDLSVFTGVLHKGKTRLYTAWWYDNGLQSTISQWKWRWDMFRGRPAYSIINVTAGDPETLRSETARIRALRAPLLER